jgi:3-methyladenine DNA glycosylase AlkC
MADQLKHFFDGGLVGRIADSMVRAHRGFPRDRFVAEAKRGLGNLELMDRGRHIAGALRKALPDDYPRAVQILIASLGPVGEELEGGGMAPFFYLPHVILVAEHGLEHFEASMLAQYELTQRFSAEFSLRAFLDRYPAESLAVLARWARDPSVHVRRLVSEGTRPRLPWAPRLRRFDDDPTPILALLEMLRDDPELYVRRSVANHLGDIAKSAPERVIAVCERWMTDATPERAWMVRHALRYLVKKGDRRALAVLGFGKTAVAVRGRIAPTKVAIGDKASIEVTVTSEAKKPQELEVDLAVHFVKADGSARPKVFKLRTVTLPAGASASAARTVTFATLTTRKPYPGRHRVEAIVNGQAFPIGHIDVASGTPGRR